MTLNLQEEVLYTQVRVKTSEAGGSGTVIYSEENKGEFSTYIITCHHVVDSAISVKSDYDPKIGRKRPHEYRQVVTVEFFDYKSVPHGRRPVNSSVDAIIMAYDKPHDMALLKLRMNTEAPNIAKLYPEKAINKINYGDKTYAVGCALLHDPILTEGMITHMGDEIDYKDYWMSSAQIIFGNSGGAVFYPYKDNYYFIGIPSRGDVIGWGVPITHLGYFSPITRIYDFMREQHFNFIFDEKFTEEKCKQTRDKIKEEAKKHYPLVEPVEEK